MHFLAELKKEHQISNIPVYLNSPMATNVTDLFCEFKPHHKLTEKECDEMCDVVHYVKSVEESKSLNLKHGPMIIISASGMATGGRILHHLKAFAPDQKNTIVLAGFQASGTRGRQLLDGAKEIKIHREFVPVRATVRSLQNISAHADSNEITHWLKESQITPKAIFITHGEPQSAEALSDKIRAEFNWQTIIPKQDQEFTLE
jgi:metallo-beta-lactamase family protein